MRYALNEAYPIHLDALHRYSEHRLRSSRLQKASRLHSLENETDLLGLVRANRDRLRGRAQLLVPRFDRVGAWRQTAQVETAVLAGHGEIRVLEHRDVAVHP